MGSTYEGSHFLDITTQDRPKFNIFGEKSHAFYTHVLKKYPFPTFEGENFLTESVLFNQLSRCGLKFRFFNEITNICRYMPDGLTMNGAQRVKSSPQGHAYLLYQQYSFGITSKKDSWDKFLEFFYLHKSNLNIFTIAKYLHQNPLLFAVKINCLRTVNKIRYTFRKIKNTSA